MLNFVYRIRYRLLLVNGLIVAVPLLGILVARFYEKEMLRGLEDDMIHQAQLLRQVLLADETGLRLEDRGPSLRAAARDTRTRIRLLDREGRLVADSHRQGPPEGPERPPPSLLAGLDSLSFESLSGAARRATPAPRRTTIPATLDVSARPEVEKALAGRYGAATRIWKGGDLVYLFSAVPIEREGAVEGVVYVTRTTVPVRAAMRRLRTTFLKVLGASLLATFVLSVFLAGTISRPLGKLTGIAERIASGDRSRSLSLHRKDEIGQLARAFDRMTRTLDERARYAGDLAANISHEFKSPLTGIRGAVELLLEGAAEDPSTRQRFLENILADAHRLDRLVTRLLELSRYEADQEPNEYVDYEALVRELVERHARIEERGGAERRVGSPTEGRTADRGRINLEFSAKSVRIWGRRTHLASALENLVENARQHAAPGTPVTIRVADAADGRIRTTVHNQGPPISEANLPRIWNRFFTTRAEHGGTGLGLPIVAMVATAHGGRAEVQGSGADGTTFSLDLPRIS